MLNMFKNRKAKRIMHEIVAEDFEKRCARISQKAQLLKYKIENGTGKAVFNLFEETIKQ